MGANNITSNSADIYWTTGGATNWNVEYGTAGFTPGTGPMMNATNDTVALTGLGASATYEFYVRDSCAVGDVSTWSGPFVFSTLCGVIIPPSLEDFSTGFPPNCWDEGDGGTPATGPTTLGTGAWTADGYLNAGSSGATKINMYNTGDQDWILSPLYDLSGAAWNAEFDFAVYNWNSTTTPGTLGSDDTVQFLISVDTGATWTVLATYDSSYVTAVGGNHELINLSAYTGNIVMFAFWASEGTVDDPEDNDIFVDILFRYLILVETLLLHLWKPLMEAQHRIAGVSQLHQVAHGHLQEAPIVYSVPLPATIQVTQVHMPGWTNQVVMMR